MSGSRGDLPTRHHAVEHAQELGVPVALPQHPDEHCPQRPVLLAVDQKLGEGAGRGVPVERADAVGAVEVWKHEDVEQLGARGRAVGL